MLAIGELHVRDHPDQLNSDAAGARRPALLVPAVV
jgi:hypothetical protein